MYQQTTREIAASIGRIGVNPRHVEAWMRVGHSTLDGLSPAQFRGEVEIAIACIDESGTERCEALARSFGL